MAGVINTSALAHLLHDSTGSISDALPARGPPFLKHGLFWLLVAFGRGAAAAQPEREVWAALTTSRPCFELYDSTRRFEPPSVLTISSSSGASSEPL